MHMRTLIVNLAARWPRQLRLIGDDTRTVEICCRSVSGRTDSQRWRRNCHWVEARWGSDQVHRKTMLQLMRNHQPMSKMRFVHVLYGT